ncbi:hypothetical protein HKK80_02795 [Halonotius sp. F2-221B]|uniref:hypothetical protein n=1 Tax=Halonotius sp. F2-221B TaxID=2731620 RepID=UPI00398B9EBC
MLLTAAVFAGSVLYPFGVAGQSAGEMRVDVVSGETELAQGETTTIEINYQAPAGQTPDTVGFDLEYDPDVLSITEEDVSSGGYIDNSISNKNVSNGVVEFTEFSFDPDNPSVNPGEPVATIEVELAEGVDEGTQTDLEFTDVTIFPEDIGTPETVGTTITAASGTQTTPDYNVKIHNPTLSQTPVDETPSDHTLNFDVVNVSADNETDNFTVTLPEEVTVEDITETTVTDASGESIAVSDDPADDDNPGRELSFAVNPNSQETTVKTLTVEVEMELSATP